jgi:hypothetical protein
MSWRRGLFRLWLVVSLLWIGSIAWETYENVFVPRRSAAAAAACAETRAANKSLGNPWDCYAGLKGGMFEDLTQVQPILIQRTMVAIGPPLGLLLFGMIVGWVLAGFRRKVA